MADVLDDLVASAYGSLTGPDGHTAFVRSLARTFRSHLISVQLDSAEHRHVTSSDFDINGNRHDEMTRVASMHPVQSPWFASQAARQLPLLGVMSDTMTGVSSHTLASTEFYQKILKPFDILHSFVFFLGAGEAGASTLGLSRSARAGSYNADEISAARILLPHLRNVRSIQQTVAHVATGIERAQATWLLAADGRICERGKQALSGPSGGVDVLVERGDKLSATYPQDRAAFHVAVENILSGSSLHRLVPLRDHSGTPRYIAHLHYCRREAFLTWLLTDPPAALVVLQPLACDPSRLEPILARLYGLTAAECRAATKLLELESIHLVAASLNRSEETIRSQVKAVFTKTGTHSQAQLLKLLYALVQG